MGRTAGEQRSTYSCRRHYLPADDPERHGTCLNVAVEIVDGAVQEQIEDILGTPAVLTTMAERRLGPSEPTATQLTVLNEQLREIETQMVRDSALFRKQGFTGTALVSVLAPLKDRHRELELEIRTNHRHASARARARSGRELEKLVFALRQGLEGADPPIMRALLLALGVRISIEAYSPCETCHGSGYMGLDPGQGRRWPSRCVACLSGLRPALAIELDDVVAVAVAQQMSGSSPEVAR